MTAYREEGRFVVRIDLSADDGYAWLERWKETVRPRLVAAVFDALRTDPAFKAVAAPRGASPEEEIEIAVTLRI